MTRVSIFLGIVILGAGVYAACSKATPEPERTSEAPQALPAGHPAVSASGAPVQIAPAADDLGWDAPKAWQSVPNANPMRKATFKIPKAAGDAEDAELTITPALGGVEPNIRRWSGQFGNAEPKTEQRSPNGLKVTVVEIKGTFAGGGMMGTPAPGPKEKYMLLGAVIDGGERQYFLKMTGPEKTVTAAKKDFDAFVASLHSK